ncbi:breast carcinoma-amplified sequence 1 isoform X1 [Archocentrus centrarchus]|uniref:breast carcinoma-amplified sequence 1 isoform X1 n=1 Tax=Archocentrus centrarchus TaxID=63155 RepID=UPI0011EA3E3D|nr:breast carcinoma-amplified sequence 1 isoform X1 [Archocentrus centrarchus]
MGNEQSISKEQLDQNGTIPEKHENGTVNGISVEITPGGLEIGGKSETTVCQNGEVHSLNLAIEPTATVEAECQPDGSETVSETPDTNVQKEEIKKSKGEKGRRNFGKLFKKKKGEVENAEEKGKETPSEDQTDDSNEEDAATVVHTDHQEGNKPGKVELSMQIEQKLEADISTQMDEGDVATANTAEELMETATTEEDSLSERAAVKAEEVVRDPLKDETSKFGAEPVEAAENLGPENSNSNDDTVSEGQKREKYLSKEFTFTIPKAVASCVEAVLAVASDCAVLASELGVGKAITEDNSKGAGDKSADVVLIETAEPESNAVTPEAGEANDITSLDKEAVTGVTETISEVVHEKPNSAAANKDKPVKEAAFPFQTENLFKAEPDHEEVPPDDAAAVEDVPPISEQENISPVTTNESAEECDSCPKAESNIVEAPSEYIHTEVPEVILKSQVIKIKPQFIPEIIITEYNAEVEEGMITEMEPETLEEIPEAAIDLLAQEFEPRATDPQEPELDNNSIVKEEEIIATVFVPLSGERGESLSPSDEPVSGEMNDEVFSDEAKTAAGGAEEDAAVRESSAKGEEEAASSEKPAEESDREEGKSEVSKDA